MLTPMKLEKEVTFQLGGNIPEELEIALRQYLLTEEIKKLFIYGESFAEEIVDATDHPLVLLPIRQTCAFLPQMDCYGELQEMHKYVLIDMSEKIDTGQYGSFRFVG